eukprot:8543464-Pyramimonas_sp.AAC.3
MSLSWRPGSPLSWTSAMKSCSWGVRPAWPRRRRGAANAAEVAVGRAKGRPPNLLAFHRSLVMM